MEPVGAGNVVEGSDTGGSSVTEQIYRKQIRPVIDDGATAIDRLFPDDAPEK